MNQPSVVLAAADKDVLRQMMPDFPRNRFVPMAGHSGNQVAEALRSRDVAAVVIHESLADMSGQDLCAWLRENVGEGLAIVLLVGRLPRRSRGPTPYDAVLRFPAGPGVLGDRVGGLIRQKWAAAGGGKDELVQDLERRVEGLDDKDYYTVLGLDRDAKHDAIRSAYDDLSLEFHPDKHLNLKDTEAHELLKTYYKRVGEAYRVLTDMGKKKAYDRQLKKGELRYDDSGPAKEGPKSLEDLSDNPRVKRFLKLAQVSIASGNTRAALQNLKFARSLDPGNELLKEKISELEAEG